MSESPSSVTATSAGQSTPADIIATVARWGVAIILIGVLVNLAMALSSLRAGAVDMVSTLAPGWLLVAALLGLAPVLFHALRIKLWSQFFGAPTTMRQCIRTSFGTELGSAVSPKAIGGAPVKIGLLIESGHTAGSAASISVLNNLEDAVLFSVLMPIAAFFTRTWEVPEVQRAIAGVFGKAWSALPIVLGVVGAIVVYVLVRRHRRAARPTTGSPAKGRLASLLEKVRDDFFAAWALVGRHGKVRFMIAVGITTMQWICRWSVATAVMYGLGESVDPVLFLLLQWVVFTMMLMMPTPGATLGAEASFAAILGAFIPAGLVGLVGAAWRFFTFYFVLLVGLAAVPLLATRRAKPLQT